MACITSRGGEVAAEFCWGPSMHSKGWSYLGHKRPVDWEIWSQHGHVIEIPVKLENELHFVLKNVNDAGSIADCSSPFLESASHRAPRTSTAWSDFGVAARAGCCHWATALFFGLKWSNQRSIVCYHEAHGRRCELQIGKGNWWPRAVVGGKGQVSRGKATAGHAQGNYSMQVIRKFTQGAFRSWAELENVLLNKNSWM